MKVSAPGCLLRRLGSSNRTARTSPALYRARAFCCGIPQCLGSVWEQQLEHKGHPEKSGMGTAGYMHGRFWNRTGRISSFWDQAQKLTKTTFCSGPQGKLPEWNCVLHEHWVSTIGFGAAGELWSVKRLAPSRCQGESVMSYTLDRKDTIQSHVNVCLTWLPITTPYYAEWSVKHTKSAAHHALLFRHCTHCARATRKGVWYWSWTFSHLTSGPGW